MRRGSLVVIACGLAGCALTACGTAAAPAPAPSPAAAPAIAPATTLFPERPELDAIAPTRAGVFKQETWTELSSGGAQHCHEWAFPAAEESALRAHAEAALARLGIVVRVDGIVRQGGVALYLGAVGSDVVSDEPLVKLTACTETEGRGTAATELRQQLARIAAEARSASAARAFALDADAAWERRYVGGRRQIGVRVRDARTDAARTALGRAGFTPTPGTLGAIDLERGPERVRFIGDRVWWQTEAPPRDGR